MRRDSAEQPEPRHPAGRRDRRESLHPESHPAGRRVRRAVAAATAELLPASRSLLVCVVGPDEAEQLRAKAWLATHPDRLTTAEAALRLGVPVSEAELVGWVSEWSVTASTRNGVTTKYLLATARPAELATDLADWLQDAMADSGVSDPMPPCPGHHHPMVPVLHNTAAWWSCPRDGLVRPWQLPRRGEPRL